MRTLAGWATAGAVALSGAVSAWASPADPAVELPQPAVSEPPVPTALAPGTAVRLMILREVNSRTAKPGDRIRLRVVEPVLVDGVIRVPVGATAWGEVVGVEANGAVGKSGRLSARLLHLDTPDGSVPLGGEHSDKGNTGGAALALAIVGFGILGLLHQGDSGRLKAGDLITGRVMAPVADTGAAPPAPQADSGPITQP
jgi:hypothetical protein